jgi:hypothetical protein
VKVQTITDGELVRMALAAGVDRSSSACAAAEGTHTKERAATKARTVAARYGNLA